MSADAAAPAEVRVTPTEISASFGERAGRVTRAQVQAAQELMRMRDQGQPSQERLRALQNIEQRKSERAWDSSMARGDKDAFKNAGTNREARVIIDRIATTYSGLDILASGNAQAQQDRLATLIRNGVVPRGTTIGEMRRQTLDAIASDQSFTALFPDIAQLTQQEKRDWIAATLPLNSILRQKVAEHMGTAHQSILELPPVPVTQRSQLEQQRDTAQTNRDIMIQRMRDVIRGVQGVHGQINLDRLSQALQVRDTNGVLNLVLTASLPNLGPNDLVNLAQYRDNNQRIRTLQQNLLQVGANQAQINGINEQINALQQANNVLFQPQDATLLLHNRLLNTIDTPLFTQWMTSYGESSQNFDGLNAQLANLPPNQAEITAKLARDTAENRILGDLDTVISKALYDVYAEREQGLQEGKIAERQQREEEDKQRGETQRANRRIQLHSNMLRNWIEGDPQHRSDTVHVRNISTDMRVLSYYGQDGLRLLMARDAGIITQAQFSRLANNQALPEQILADAFREEQAPQGVQESDADRQAREERNRNRVDNKAQLEEFMKDKEVTDYRNTLLDSYMKGERFMREGVWGYALRLGRGIRIDGTLNDRSHYGLQENEWSRLYGHFGEEIENSLNRVQEAATFIRNLRDRGIIRESNMKGFMRLLLMLLGIFGGVGGAAAALGAAPLGAAAGFTELGAEALAGIAGAGVAGGVNQQFNR